MAERYSFHPPQREKRHPGLALTGATGFVGRAVVHELWTRGRRCMALARVRSETARLQGYKVTWVTGDLGQPTTLVPLLRGAKVLVHLAAALGADRAQLEAVNVAGTRHLVEAAQEAGVERLILLSAAVAGQPAGPYGRSKRAAEEIVEQSGLPHIILRPPLIYGAGSQLGGMLERLGAAPLLALPGGGRLQPVHVEDVARTVVEAALGEGLPARSPYALPGPELIDLPGLARRLGRQRGRPGRVLRMPRGMARWAARVAERLPGSPFSREVLASIESDLGLSATAAAEDLGFAPVGIDEGLARPALVAPAWKKR